MFFPQQLRFVNSVSVYPMTYLLIALKRILLYFIVNSWDFVSDEISPVHSANTALVKLTNIQAWFFHTASLTSSWSSERIWQAMSRILIATMWSKNHLTPWVCFIVKVIRKVTFIATNACNKTNYFHEIQYNLKNTEKQCSAANNYSACAWIWLKFLSMISFFQMSDNEMEYDLLFCLE